MAHSTAEQGLPADPEPGSRRQRLFHFMTHERRCWCRVVYWLKQFQYEDGVPLRCYAWRDADRPGSYRSGASRR